MVFYRIKNWAEHFETAESRKRKGPLSWVAVSTSFDGKRFRRLTRHEKSAEIFGAFVLIVEAAGRCRDRGTLIDDHGDPILPDDLEDMTGFPAKSFALAFEILSNPRIGWIERKKTGKDEIDHEESAGACRSVPERAGGPVLPNRTEHDITEQDITEQPAAVASGDSEEEKSKDHSRSRSVGRAKGKVRYMASVAPLLGRRQGGRCPPDSKEFRADETCAVRVFDEIWPDDDDVGESFPELMALVKEAGKPTTQRPMAWLQDKLKRKGLMT